MTTGSSRYAIERLLAEENRDTVQSQNFSILSAYHGNARRTHPFLANLLCGFHPVAGDDECRIRASLTKTAGIQRPAPGILLGDTARRRERGAMVRPLHPTMSHLETTYRPAYRRLRHIRRNAHSDPGEINRPLHQVMTGNFPSRFEHRRHHPIIEVHVSYGRPRRTLLCKLTTCLRMESVPTARSGCDRSANF